MKLYDAKNPFGSALFDVRGKKIYATTYNNQGTSSNRSMPWYEIRGDKIYKTAFHPEGHNALPMYIIRGNEVHTSLNNPVHSSMPVFLIK